ncbi:hypothetical protein [Kineococcus sp. G2]|uniref:hypothetical protein n=1 Tax=Kineococcus sp. G2 TaxID=3127484 RepID=UPI00301C1A3A
MSGDQAVERTGARAPHDPRQRYRALPEPIRLADVVETQESQPVPDPTAGRDPERDFMLRYL